MLNPGDTFGRLSVIELDHVDDKKNIRFYKCKCSCENKTTVIVRESSLKYGYTKSCGCYKKEVSSQILKSKWKEYRKENNFVCPQCGNTKHYAKGLCKACYTRQLRGVSNKIYAFPMNILLTIGIPIQNITQNTMDNIIDFIDSGAITDRQKTIVYGYYFEQKTYKKIGEELGISGSRVEQILNQAMKVLKNTDTIDYILGLLPYEDKIKELQKEIEMLEKLKDKKIKEISSDIDETLKKITVNSIQGLSKRAYNGLMRNNIKTLYDLSKLQSDGYKRLHYVGAGTWKEIVQKGAEYGVMLE